MHDIIIIGGGLAGLVNAVHLSRGGLKVLLIEKNDFPKHKVCGEYISNEVLPYLQSLGADPFELGATAIDKFMLSTPRRKVVKTQLPLGGFGISRYTLDHHLSELAKKNGCTIEKANVGEVQFLDNHFEVKTKSGQTYLSKFVIGAYGKRSNLDMQLKRPFIQEKAPFLAVKSHYEGDFPEDLVALYNFNGGYCGVSKVENGYINICYLVDYATFKTYRNLETFQEEVLYQNLRLKEVLQTVKPAFEKPLTISQISFSSKQTVEQHVLMSGDTAGMIHPLAGNGMGMAIHSAKILSELLLQFYNSKNTNRTQLEQDYSKEWDQTFRKRLWVGKLFNSVFSSNRGFEIALSGLTLFPWTLPFFIKQTHGEKLQVQADKKYK